ncbi:MAG: alpha-E domain-containing protein [Acidobacteriia bacterium]|nr:alpha-E domain-containing protein [Terriglobia bacterium]
MTSTSKPLLSRVAESVYWMARYIERAENVARFVGVNLHLRIDLPQGDINGWQALIDTSGDAAVFLERYRAATPEHVLEFLVFDTQNRNSILSCVRSARENARSVRETISSEMWEEINSFHLMLFNESVRPGPDSLPEFFQRMRRSCHLFQGITDATMTHNEAWHFIQLGRELERADKTTRLLDVKYFILLPSASDVGTPYDDIQWSAVLKSVSGFEMYRKAHGRIVPVRIVEFLLLDSDFPRAVSHCVAAADRSLHAITGTPPGSYSCASEQRMGLLRSDLAYAQVEAILAGGLHEFLDGLQAKMNRIDECILEDFFARRAVSTVARA